MNLLRIIFPFAFGLALFAPNARAQNFELKAGNFNNIYVPFNSGIAPPNAAAPSGPPNVSNPAPTDRQSAAVGQVAGSSGAIDATPVDPVGNPPAYPATVHADIFPSNPGNTYVLTRSTIGSVFASGVPRYFLADVITPPMVQADGVTPAAANYWRQQPILPGDSFQGVNGGVPLVPLGSVNVLTASVNTTTVTISNSPAPTGLVVGASLLGQPISKIVGTTVTLAGNANTSISASSIQSIIPVLPYYYSPHAEKVYASQPGSVTITWVTRLANGGGNYSSRQETFAVSSNTTRPVRTIYWTEGSFDGPKVQITDARIGTVNPVFNNAVPKAVPEEVSIPGYNPLVSNLSTLYFEKFNGVGQLRAYNLEGRILIEYLGDVRLANVYESLGIDVVELKREPDVVQVVQNLGKELLPRVPAQVGDDLLVASPSLSTSQGATSFYGTSVRADGSLAYFAERETSAANNPDNGEPASSDAYNKVVFYWLETPEDGFGIKWPKFQSRYWQRWSPNLGDYAHYTVGASGSTPDTGISFAGGTLPTIVSQDDPAQAEARIDLAEQKLFVTFSPSNAYLRNRSLLKFSNSGNNWYVNLYSQAETRQITVSAQQRARGFSVTTYQPLAGGGLLAPVSNLIAATPKASFGSVAAIDYSNNFNLPGLTGTDQFAVLWQGWFDASQNGPGDYTFGTNSDDGSVIYLDLNGDGDFSDPGELIVDNNGNHAPQAITGTVNLTGVPVRIAIGYYEDSLGEVMNARWKKGTNLPFASLDTIQGTTGLFYNLQAGNTLELASTTGLEVGMVVRGGGVAGGVTITRIIDNRFIEVSTAVPPGTYNLTLTVESDGTAPINTTAIVGTRIEPPAGHEISGYISGGKGYYPAGYLNPFIVGVTAANRGAIIPVNALPTDNALTVRWFKKVAAPSEGFQDLYVPGKIGRYSVVYPNATTPQIYIAAGVGSGNLSAAEALGSVYTQNVAAQPGYNPNEEHALMIGGRAYALREDLNVTTGNGYTSQPFVLVAYTDPADQRPAIHAYKVLRVADFNENGIKDPGDIFFDYTSTAGTLLVKPYPLPLMPLPLVGSGVNRTSKDLEIIGADDPANATVGSDAAYESFTFKDRKGFTWVHRGPHDTGTPTLSMKLYYLSRTGFFVPGIGEPPVDTVLPFLRNPARSGQPLNITSIDNGQSDEPLTVIYRPAWPTDAAELRVGETLTLPKFDLPQVRGQASAQVFYQQSIANAPTASGLTKNSVTLHDPTRQKTLELDPDGVALDGIPAIIRTTSYQGKTYFQNLPPSLQKRFFLDPTASLKGTLYFTGVYHNGADEGFSGDNYLDLNLMTTAEAEILKGLAPDEPKWAAAIDSLKTSVETFVPDPAQLGIYQVGSSSDVYATNLGGRNPLTVIDDPNTAVDSYALTATGQGTGFVTMVFGNSGNPDQQPQGDPVEVKVFRIADQLYPGDLKVVQSSNPLDEQVTLRHSGDFAGKPEDYEFEWRWTTGAASEPATYTYSMMRKIGDPVALTDRWQIVSDPGALRPTAEQYAATTPRQLGSTNVHPVTGIFNAQGALVSLPATKVTVPSTAALSIGTTVIGPGITGIATISSIIDSTSYVLSQLIPDATHVLTYGGALSMTSTSSPLSNNIDETRSYTEEEMATDYPALVVKSTVGLDFSPSTYPLGVPENIVLSAKLGSLDGCVLYVNSRVALAFRAPTPRFTLTNSSSGLTDLGNAAKGGNSSLKQFYIPRGFFNAGPNMIEIAIYSTADANAFSDLNFIIEAAGETDNVTSGPIWQNATGQSAGTGILPYSSSVLVGGPPTGPFSSPQFVLNDRWFTLRYRPKSSASNVLGTPWSRWTPPQFVEGWIKRVLAAINPFEQRVKDLFNNSVNTDVSLLTQAGQRWEGDIALTLDAVDDAGLIEIYETVLNRGKNISINANTNDPDTNNALLLAAGYLNDLYSILGNEAFADAANPTISIDDATSAFEVNSSRFSFEGQVESSLVEELALLRGRDDSVSPGVNSAPIYNRLIWNYTRGINSGEAIYAVNYNIKEKAGSSTADGVIDESDARRMFPQGHGDAYGHYLTALTGYYRLLTNPNFDWQARGEAVTVNGQAVTVDYQDERKFAAAAGNLARTAQQIVGLTHRQSYRDDPAAGWTSFQDDKGTNPQTGVASAQGLDEWVSRSTQGAYFNWIVGNALVPDVDPIHTGVQKIDRTTVPELPQLAAAAATFQTTIDNANAHLNPLGLSPGAVAFDIDPYFTNSTSNGLQGKSQHEQIYDRALRSLNNAAGAFNQAATMTRSLRNQTNQLDDFNTAIVEQELAYRNQLIEIYGRPYSGDIGAGRLYAQGYTGPDLLHWFIADRPTDLVDTAQTFTISLSEANQIAYYTGDALRDITAGLVYGDPDANGNRSLETTYTNSTVTIRPSQWVQYADVWKSGGLGSRPVTGELQEALQDAQVTWMDLYELNVVWQRQTAQLDHLGQVFRDLVRTHQASKAALVASQAEIAGLEALGRDLEIAAFSADYIAGGALALADASSEYLPTVFGLSVDGTAPGRGAIKTVGVVAAAIANITAGVTRTLSLYQQSNILSEQQSLERTLQELGFNYEEVQLAYEYQRIYIETVTGANELMQLMVPHQRALQRVNNVLAKGDRVQAEREVFRQRAAAIIQGYRTKDLSFRVFRNEALEQYRSLFDLASRYSYLSAKAYDYETGLLGSTQGSKVFANIVASRSLGDLTGGVPQNTTSTLGDAGLAGIMAQINADFAVAKGRLGINNPDHYGTVFSLRGELFRLLNTPGSTLGDEAWRQTLERHMVPNVMSDSDVANQCRNIAKPDGSAVPGIIIEFGSTIEDGRNFFGLPLAAYDHAFSASSFATKISNAGIVLKGYVGMDPSIGGVPATGQNSANALSGTPYVYLIPCGVDSMRAPLSGDSELIRSWNVQDQALPLPYNLGASDFNTTNFFNANGTLSEQPWIIRKHQAFRAVGDPELFYGGSSPLEFSNSRLIARSVWNTRWKIVIPAYTLLNNEQEGLKRFAASVEDVMLYLRTYSHSGN